MCAEEKREEEKRGERARARACARSSACGEEEKKKKKRKRQRTGCFLPSNRQPRCYFSCGRYPRRRASSAGCRLRHTAACIWLLRGFSSFSRSVISDAIGSISKVKASFVEASARRAPPCGQEPQGLFALGTRAGRSKLGHRDSSQPPQLGFLFLCFCFFAFVSGTSSRITRLAGEFLSNYRGGREEGGSA